MRLQAVEMLYLLWVIPLLAGFYALAAQRRRRALRLLPMPDCSSSWAYPRAQPVAVGRPRSS